MRRRILLLGLALCSLLVYVALVQRFPLGRYLDVPRANVGSITKRDPWAALLLAVGGIVLHAAYIGAVLWCWEGDACSRLVRPLLWGYALAAGLVLVLIWPVTSTDVFDYLFRGRMTAEYSANPYIVPPNRFRDDPLFRYLGWPNAPSAYGPLWELMSARMAALGGTSLVRNVLFHKVLALGTFLLCGLVLVLMTRVHGPQAQLRASVLWLWSPLALWEIVAAGHNDGFLILSLLLAIWAVSYGHYNWAATALVVGALFKFLPVIVLPLVVVHGMRRRETWPSRIRLAAEIGLISAVLIVLAYRPFWQGLATLNNIGLREKFLNAAPLALLTFTVSTQLPGDAVRSVVSRIGSLLLFGGILWQMWQIWRNGRDLVTACFGLLAWYLIFASQWFQPWYVLWLLALLALRPSRARFAALETWALSAQASYLLQYFGLAWLGWPGNALPGQVLYFLVIFVPPLIVFALTRWRGRSAGRFQPAPAAA